MAGDLFGGAPFEGMSAVPVTGTLVEIDMVSSPLPPPAFPLPFSNVTP